MRSFSTVTVFFITAESKLWLKPHVKTDCPSKGIGKEELIA